MPNQSGYFTVDAVALEGAWNDLQTKSVVMVGDSGYVNIKQIDPECMSLLSPEQVAMASGLLTEYQLNHLPNDSYLKSECSHYSKVSSWEPKAIGLLNTDKLFRIINMIFNGYENHVTGEKYYWPALNWGYLSDDQVEQLSKEQINYIAKNVAKNWAAYSPAQIEAISPKFLSELSVDQLLSRQGRLNTSQVQHGINEQQWSRMLAWQLTLFTERISRSQIQLIGKDGDFSRLWDVAHWADRAIQFLTETQLMAIMRYYINEDQFPGMRWQALTSEQMSVLSANKINLAARGAV